MFPAEDKDLLSFSIEAQKGTVTDVLEQRLDTELQDIIMQYPEVKFAYRTINNDTINGTLDLMDADIRKDK